MGNEETLRKAFLAFDTGDMDTFWSAISDDVTMHWPGRSPLAGDHVGREQFAQLVDRELEIMKGGGWEGQYDDILVNGDRCVVLERGHGWLADGRTIDVRIAIVCDVKDGKIVEMWEHPFDLYAWDEFWS